MSSFGPVVVGTEQFSFTVDVSSNGHRHFGSVEKNKDTPGVSLFFSTDPKCL